MPAIRVLHVLHSMNCGGAETLIMNVYRSIDRSKIQFDFLVNCFDEMFYEKEIEHLGGKIFRMKFLTKVSPPIYEKHLYDFFKNYNYKIVHSHLETTTGIILKQAKKAGVPIRIAHSHNSRFTKTGFLAALENVYKIYCRKKIVPNATNLLSCSDMASEWLYGDKKEKAVLIKNGIEAKKYAFDLSERREMRDELKIPDSTTVIGHVGRFNEQKNHSFLIDAFEDYHLKEPNSILVLVGEGSLENEIHKKVETRGLSDSVKFLGLRGDINKVLESFDFFLLPSLFEGLPLVIVEAQAAGLPSFVSDTVSPLADLGCGLVKFLPINEGVCAWTNAICSSKNERRVTTQQIVRAGYDISTTAKELEKIYLGSQ